MTAAEGLHALLVQISGLRQHLREGWYQVRIAGHDVASDKVMQRLHEPLPPGAIVHIVPRMEGAAKGGIFQFIAGAVLTTVGLLTSWTGISSALTAAGIGMMLGGVAQMLTPTPRTPASSQGDNGKGNSYFSNLDNAVHREMSCQFPMARSLPGRGLYRSPSVYGMATVILMSISVKLGRRYNFRAIQ